MAPAEAADSGGKMTMLHPAIATKPFVQLVTERTVERFLLRLFFAGEPAAKPLRCCAVHWQPGELPVLPGGFAKEGGTGKHSHLRYYPGAP